jgi:hypothetical protein
MDGKRFDLIPSTHHVFPFILLTRFDQKASIEIVENPNLERKKRESSPYLDGGAEKGCCTSPWFSSRRQQQGRRRPWIWVGAALGRTPRRGQGRGGAQGKNDRAD